MNYGNLLQISRNYLITGCRGRFQKDIFNIQIVAQHLRKLIDHDGLQKSPLLLDMDQVRIVGARYNRSIGLSLEDIKKNMSYGNFNCQILAPLYQSTQMIREK